MLADYIKTYDLYAAYKKIISNIMVETGQK